FGDSYKAPQEETGKGPASETSVKKKGRTVIITTEYMQKRRNNVKARTTLLLALLDEHQLRFSKYKTAKELWEATLKTFGGNEATKKTKKNQLKQQYSNFMAEGSETLEQTFNRLQAIMSHLDGKGEVHTASVLTTSTQVSTASTNLAAASISHDTICAYIASQSTGSQIKYGDITQIDEDDIKEIDIKWNMALLSMRADRFWKKTSKKITIQGSDVAGFDKSKVEYFNCHKMGYFARECRAPRSQDRGRRENYKQGPKEEEPALKALMVIDGIGWDWSYMANEENTKNLNTKISKLNEELSDCENNLYHYKIGLSQVEAKLVEFKTQEIKFCEKDRGLKRDVEVRNNKIEYLMNELEQVKKEKEGLDNKLTGFESTLKDLDTLLGSQRTDKNKEGLGYSAVPPPPAQVYSAPKKDMS
nr:hypothetical protein [Tanacetum cinerariifolium]